MFIFALNLPHYYLDNITFQLVFVVINIYLSVPLFNELIPPELSTEQRELYKKHFKRFFKPSEFKYLLSKARRRVYKVTTLLANRGNGFSSMFFVVSLPKNVNSSISLKQGRNKLMDLGEYSWIGKLQVIV